MIKIGKLKVLLRKLVMSKPFHSFLMLLIISYLISLAVSSNLDYSVILNINLVYTCIFIVELSIKLLAFGIKGFKFKTFSQVLF